MDWFQAHQIIAEARQQLESPEAATATKLANAVEPIELLINEVEMLDDLELPDGLYGYLSPIRELLEQIKRYIEKKYEESAPSYDKFVESMPEPARDQFTGYLLDLYEISYERSRT